MLWAISGMPSFLASGKTAALVLDAQARMEAQQVAGLAVDLFFIVGVNQEGQRAAVHARSRLDHIGDVSLLLLVVKESDSGPF